MPPVRPDAWPARGQPTGQPLVPVGTNELGELLLQEHLNCGPDRHAEVGSKVLSDLLLREGPKIGNVCHLGCSFTSCQGGDVLVDFGKELPFFVPAGQLRFTQNTGRNLDELRTKATEADSVDSLLGIEGAGARAYFGAFSGMLRPPKDRGLFDLDFERRNRRPPTDPINSLLSFCYALLTKDWTIAIASVGLDPYLGFFHRPRYGRPSLALDLMEEFRPIIADSVVVSVVNNGIVQADDFTRTGLGVALKPPARKRVIEAYERRMDQLVTHPVFDYRISYRRVLDVQARLLGRFLLGELKEYPSFLTR